MLPDIKTLVEMCDAYAVRHGITRTAFGRLVLKDPTFVHDIAAGKRMPTVRTLMKVVEFLENN